MRPGGLSTPVNMPDFIDQLFEKAAQNNSGFVDASREELLDDVEQQPTPQRPAAARQQQQQQRVAGRNNRQRGGMDLIQAGAKWVEENIGIPLEDTIDNVFQGNQRTPEQVARDRARRDQNMAQQLRQQKTINDLPNPAKAVLNPVLETGRVIAGGMTGAAESILNTAEIAGDTGKYFASLGRVKEDQNPFSSKYEWANWDLGRNEIGAQTGIGKVAQGFLEFGTLMAATGGFGGLSGAGASFAAAGTNLAKASVAVKAGSIGALSGLAADMISASKGEGNLSNLIKENAPEWYPTWLTALAIDEDDSPYEVMLKTGFEGMGLGFAADALGAYVGGVRELRRLKKAGVADEQAAAEAVQTAQEILNSTTPSASSFVSTQPVSPEEYVQRLEATKASDPNQYWSVDAVDLESAKKGQVVAVDGGYGLVSPDGDIKGVFKDPSVTRKGVADEILQAAVRRGGIKLDNFDNYLSKIYERNGFRKVGTVPFSREYAPPGWDEAAHGTPDVVAMVYDPKNILDLGEPRQFTDYDDLISYRDRIIEAHPELKPVKAQLTARPIARASTPLPNGNRIEWRFSTDQEVISAYRLPRDTKALEVTWDMGDSGELIQNYGRRVYSDFQRIAREELEPGTILYNAPASDTYGRGGASAAQIRRVGGDLPNNLEPVLLTDEIRTRFIENQRRMYPDWDPEGFTRRFNAMSRDEMLAVQTRFAEQDPELFNRILVETNNRNTGQRRQIPADQRGIRERLYSRAGFGPVNSEGIQAAIVRSEPDARGRWLMPITDFNNPQAIIDAVNSQRHYLKRADDMLRNLPRQDAVNELAARINQETYDDLARLQGYDQMSPDQIREAYALEHGGRDPWGSMDNTNFQSARIREARQAGYESDPRRQALERLIAQSQQGIPITWDDAAEVVPELFTPGARQIDQINRQVLREIEYIRPNLPVVIDPATGLRPAGFAVNIDLKRIDDISEEGLNDFLASNQDLLSREEVAFKISHGNGGATKVDIVRIVGDESEAKFLGNLFDQPEIVDAGLSRTIQIGGSDSLRGTQGQHLASQIGTPMPSRTVDSTTAVMQQMESRANPNGSRGGSQRTVTDAQLRRIARSIGDEPAQLLRQMVRENPVDLRELSSVSRRSVDEIVNEAAVGIQEALGIAGEVDFSKILKQQVGEDELLTQAGIVQVRGLMQELTTRLYESGYNIMKMGEVNMDTYPQVVRMADELKALMRIHKESSNAYSRYLSTYKIKVPILGIEIDNPVKPPSVEELAREIKNADKVLDDIVTNLASGDIEARNKAWRLANALMLADGDPSKMPTLGKYMTAITTSKGLNLLYNSLLSAPKTHIVNTMSNAMNVAYRPIAAATGGDVKVKRAAAASLYNIHQTLNDAFKMAAKAMKEGAVNDGDKGLIAAAEADQQLKILQRAAEVSNDNTFKAGVGLISMLKDISDFPLFSWPSKLLTGSDEFFKTMVSRMEYNSQTMLRAIEESTGTGKPVQETFERLVKANMDLAFDPKTGQILDNNLLATAKEVTFQTDLEGWAKAFGDFINAVPPLRIFFPFVKTGHNIMVYSGTHVPYLGRYLSEYKAVMAGDDAYAKAVMRGRQAYGTMIVAAAGLAAHNGMITGNGPPDPQERKTWQLQNPARSILIGNTWVEYSRIEPFGQILSAIADVYDMFSAGRLSEDRAMYLAGYMTYAIAANLTNKSFMQGVVPLGQILTPGWQGLNTLAKLPAESINNFLPLSGARRSLANLMTPYKQEFNSQFDQLVYQASAGLVKVGAPMHDWLDGSRVPSNTGGVNALNPLAMRPRNTDVVRDILEDIEFDSSIISKSLSGVKLDREHRSRMQQLMGQGSLHKELKAWVTHKDFKPAVEAFLGRLRAGERVMKENEPFYNEIVRIIERNRDLAVDQVKQEFPELRDQILDAKAIRNSQSRPGGNPKSIDFENLVNMPK